MKNKKLLILVLMSVMATSAIFAQNTTAKTYEIGDIGPGGGIVFYVFDAGFPVPQPNGETKMCNYLEVSPISLVTTWCFHRRCKVNTSNGLGDGLINTYNIVSSHDPKKLTIDNCAAYACSKYYTGTTKQGEWFLPSITELNLLHINLGNKHINLGSKINSLGFKINEAGYMWSSSQHNNSSACCKLFYSEWPLDNGKLVYEPKHCVHAVRAVRAF